MLALLPTSNEYGEDVGKHPYEQVQSMLRSVWTAIIFSGLSIDYVSRFQISAFLMLIFWYGKSVRDFTFTKETHD